MSLLASRVGMIHRCTLTRDASLDSPDAWGSPSTPDFQPHISGLPCRAWTNAGRELAENDKTVVVEDRRIAVTTDTDVTERDQVLSVTDTAGATIFPGPMNVLAVLRYRDHIELSVEQIR